MVLSSLESMTGFEPVHTCFADRPLSHLGTSTLAVGVGIEPTALLFRQVLYQLSYPTKSLVPRRGIEPHSHALQACAMTTLAHPGYTHGGTRTRIILIQYKSSTS